MTDELITLPTGGNLTPAPRIFKCGEEILKKDMPPSAFAEIERQGTILNEYVEITDDEIPDTPGKVVDVCQVASSGSGYIRVRWGTKGEVGSVLAEYRFRGNPDLSSKTSDVSVTVVGVNNGTISNTLTF